MKVKFEDMKKAMNWIEANTKDMSINMVIDVNVLTIRAFDKFDSEVVIEVYDDGNRLPKIKRTDILEWPPKK